MLLEKELKKIVDQLIHSDVVQIPIGNSDLTLRHFNQSSKVVLSTPVYFGGNFIPSSVRRCAAKADPFKYQTSIKTSLFVDEDKFQISLIYLDDMANLYDEKFSGIVEEFSGIADKWRLILDEHDRNDLVYIPLKS